MNTPVRMVTKTSPAVSSLLSRRSMPGDAAKGSEMTFAFEKLLAYQNAVTFADAVCTLTRGFTNRRQSGADAMVIRQVKPADELCPVTPRSKRALSDSSRSSSGFVQPRRF
ncbi:MAG: hypothetical protein ACOC95_07075 [Planctomycetota bacterium]